MEYNEAYVLGATALIDALPAESPSDHSERLKAARLYVEAAKETLGGSDAHSHDEWLAICSGMSHVAELWVDTGDISQGAPIE
jgi:hypothetical protein